MDFSSPPTMTLMQAQYTFDVPLRPAPGVTSQPVTSSAHSTLTPNNGYTTSNTQQGTSQPPTMGTARGNWPEDNTKYTYVCGVIIPEKAAPIKANKPAGHFKCPRCDTEFSRSYSVKQHFPSCVALCGNPAGLSWNDHESCKASGQKLKAGVGKKDNRRGLRSMVKALQKMQQEANFIPGYVVSQTVPAGNLVDLIGTIKAEDRAEEFKHTSIETDEMIKQEPELDDNGYNMELETDGLTVKQEPSGDSEGFLEPYDSQMELDAVKDEPIKEEEEMPRAMRDDEGSDTPRARSPNSEPPWAFQAPNPDASPTPFCYTPAPMSASYQQNQRNESEESDGLSWFMDRRTHYSETPAPRVRNSTSDGAAYPGEEMIQARDGDEWVDYGMDAEHPMKIEEED